MLIMANIKYTGLPAATTVVDGDLWAQSQNISTTPVSKKVTSTQFWAYVLSKTLTNAGTPNGAVAGTANQLCFDSTNKIIYICTSTGSSSTAVWNRAGNTFSHAGDPNGNTAGQLYDFVYDTTGTKLWVCSTAGTSSTATWTSVTSNLSNPVTLAQGGTNNNITADNGGIVYSDASKLLLLAHNAAAGHILQSGASVAPTWSTPTYPSASGTSLHILISDGTNNVYSTPAYPNASVTAGKVIISDGTNYIASTSIFPNTVGTALHLVLSDGTSNVYSTPAYPNASVTAGKVIISDGTNYIASTSIFPNTVGTTGKILISDGTSNVYSTPTYPAAAGTTGNVLTSDGTNWLSSSATGTGTVNSGLQNQLAYYAANGTAVSGLATAASGVLVTSAGSIPSISSTLPAFTTSSITFSPTTGGIVGTTTNDNADAGKVGEFVSSTIAVASAINPANTTPTNLTSISLTAGDWDVWGNVGFSQDTVGFTLVVAYISNATAGALPDASLYNSIFIGAASGMSSIGINAPGVRLSLSTTTTIYIIGRADYSAGTTKMFGGIFARRAR
jgi:hypothetical protein